ncbi:hypothetical protein BDZ91DRAFT_737698 [Kalaharituber pfeilii]|nr:hypothetical protein BDZ91DRAFT_737698 [Kalaharituber pfeilii]
MAKNAVHGRMLSAGCAVASIVELAGGDTVAVMSKFNSQGLHLLPSTAFTGQPRTISKNYKSRNCQRNLTFGLWKASGQHSMPMIALLPKMLIFIFI